MCQGLCDERASRTEETSPNTTVHPQELLEAAREGEKAQSPQITSSISNYHNKARTPGCSPCSELLPRWPGALLLHSTKDTDTTQLMSCFYASLPSHKQVASVNSGIVPRS